MNNRFTQDTVSCSCVLQELRPINEDYCNNKNAPDEDGVAAARRRALCGAGAWSGRVSAEAVDKAARLLFPITFCLFNFIYWIYYLQSGV